MNKIFVTKEYENVQEAIDALEARIEVFCVTHDVPVQMTKILQFQIVASRRSNMAIGRTSYPIYTATALVEIVSEIGGLQ